MKVFISHTFIESDIQLAKQLQKTLSDAGIDGYLAETRKEYDALIRDKIIKEIKNSDHMVAILTEETFDSASVNQELGYALREGISPIIMLEKNAKQGVLTFGIDPEDFSKSTFSQSCQNILDHIKQKGFRKKIPENFQDISDQLQNLESKITSQNNSPQINPSDNKMEDKWYEEIMAYCRSNPLSTSYEKQQAKQYYSKIKILKDEISEISRNREKSGLRSVRLQLSNELKIKKSDLTFNMDQLTDVWTRSS